MTRYVVVGGSLAKEFTSSGQVEVDQVLVPEIPHSGDTLEALFEDLASYLRTCREVDASGTVEGVWLQGDPPVEVQGKRPLESGRGYAYTVGLTVAELRSAISTGVRGRYSQLALVH